MERWQAQISRKCAEVLFARKRHKGLYGGRGASKSWGVADYLIGKAMQEKRGILCCRELQNSIKDSVHRLIKERILFYKLDKLFEVTDSEIRYLPNGSFFIFKGLKSNAPEIKSIEGLNVAWCEEAEKLSEDSHRVLVPTIRAGDSPEIIYTWNTGFETDFIYQYLVVNPPEDSVCRLINFYDNPWFPEALRSDMEYDKRTDPVKYENVWLGKPCTGGRFFTTFGTHLAIRPRFLDDWIAEPYRLIGSLDHGITHPTSYGMWLINRRNELERLFSYSANGGTTKGHALAIHDLISNFPYTGGRFPSVIVFDPSMLVQDRKNEEDRRSDIDEYKDVFAYFGRATEFEPAMNAKYSRDVMKSGCTIMRTLFSPDEKTGRYRFGYWEGFNDSFVEGLRRVEQDANNKEAYKKQDGDDEADEARYGMAKAWSLMHNWSDRKAGNYGSNIRVQAAMYNRSIRFAPCGV